MATPELNDREGHHKHMVEFVPAGECTIHLLGGTACILNNTTTYHSLNWGLCFVTG